MPALATGTTLYMLLFLLLSFAPSPVFQVPSTLEEIFIHRTLKS